MSMNDLILLLFKGNLKKYRLFIGCNVLAIAILFSIRVLLDHPILNDPNIVDPMISSNVYAPTLFMHVFVVFFIPFTLSILNKQIQKNYGILMSLGLTQSQLRKCVLLENCFSIVVSVFGGIVVGNLFEIVLIGILKRNIGIEQMTFSQSINAYEQTVIFLLVIYAIALGFMMFSLEKRDILKIVIGERESEEKKGSRIWFVVGVILFIVSLVWSYLWYEKTEGNILLLGMFMSFIGIAISVGNSEVLLRKIKSKNLFLFSDYLYYFKRNRSISLMLIVLYGLLIFFNVTSSVTKNSLEENVKDYNPYDLVYADYSDEEKINMDDYARQCGTEVQYAAKVHFFYTRTNAVFGADDVNQETGSAYKVPNGKFIIVRSVVLNDGYPHETGRMPKQMEIEEQTFDYYMDVDQVLFCRGGGLTDSIILLNQKDYDHIVSSKPEIVNTLNLYRFYDWKKTKGLSAKIQSITDADVASLYEDSIRADQSARLLIILMAYISIVFVCNVCITIHYKLASELEKDNYKYRLLRSIGAKNNYILKCQMDKNVSIIVWPLIIAIIWMMIVAYINTFTYGYQFIALGKCGVVSAVLTVAMFGICVGYTKKKRYP